MNFTMTGRGVHVSDKLQDYIEKKIPRLEKYFHQLMDVRVIIYTEKMDHITEMIISGDGSQFYGQEKGGDFYSAADLLLDTVESQLARFKEKHQLHKGVHLGTIPLINLTSDSESQVLINEASAKPVNMIEAFLELKIEKRDYHLFLKGSHLDLQEGGDSFTYALMYREGESFHLAECTAKGAIAEYDLKVKKDSATNPEIDCVKSTAKKVKSMKIGDALNDLVSLERRFIPFFNNETNAMNVLFRKGQNIGVLIPASK